MKVIVKKLGRQRAYGLADTAKGVIEIDPRQKSKAYLDTLIHEAVHIAFPDLSERQVNKKTKIIRDFLWNHGYRKVNL